MRGGVPDYAKSDQIRVVKLIPEDGGYPCGGTHVASVRELSGMRITKINKKGKMTRMSYIV